MRNKIFRAYKYGISFREKIILVLLLITFPSLAQIIPIILDIANYPFFIIYLIPSVLFICLLFLERRFINIRILTFIFSLLYLLYVSNMALFALALGASDSGGHIAMSSVTVLLIYSMIIICGAAIFVPISFVKLKSTNKKLY